MPDISKTPRVGIKVVHQDGHFSVGTGYLVIRDGQHWLVRNEEDIDKDPHASGALPLDSSLLEPQPTQPEDPPLYYYRVTFRLE